jgi:DNA modification methylase
LIPNITDATMVSALGAALAVLKTLLPISEKGRRGNIHSTVKPIDLMCYLCRLITPKGGTVLDPFMGSGSTGKAAQMEGFNFIGIELDPEYFKIAKARIEDADNLFTREAVTV